MNRRAEIKALVQLTLATQDPFMYAVPVNTEIPETLYPEGWFTEAARVNLNECCLYADVQNPGGGRQAVLLFLGSNYGSPPRNARTIGGQDYSKARIKNTRGTFTFCRLYHHAATDPIPF